MSNNTLAAARVSDPLWTWCCYFWDFYSEFPLYFFRGYFAAILRLRQMAILSRSGEVPMELWSYASVELCRYASMELWSYAPTSLQVRPYATRSLSPRAVPAAEQHGGMETWQLSIAAWSRRAMAASSSQPMQLNISIIPALSALTDTPIWAGGSSSCQGVLHSSN